MVLFSKASGKTLRIRDDKSLEGRGGEGTLGKHCVYIASISIYIYGSSYAPGCMYM